MDGFAAFHGDVEGEKGGGSSSRQPVVAENSLRAKMTLDVIYLLGEGPQAGLVDGAKSILIGEPPVPLVAADNTANFQGVEWEYRDGSPGQAPFTGVPAVQTTTAVGARVSVAGGPIVQAYDCTLADRLRFIVQVPALLRADTNTGDQSATTVQVRFEWRVSGSGSGWNLFTTVPIGGKCTAPYARAVNVPVPTRQILDVRCVRDTADSTTAELQDDTYWHSTVVITDRLLEYPGSCMVRMKVDAEQFGSQPPIATFLEKQLLCWVPMNYDPVARTYATSGVGTSGGIWDGTFKRAFSDNAAWVWYTLATDTDVGCGRELAGAVDRYAAYQIGVYCDEQVPNGYGSTEPRYTVNCHINTRDEAVRVLQSIAQAFRGMLYWGGGQIVPVADLPKNPVKAVTPANVIDGRFEYQGSSLNARHNVVKVRYRDPALNYRETIEVVQDPESIALYGMIKEVDLEAFGCTSRGMARRFGKWVLYTEKHETETVTYQAYRDHANIAPGDIITVSDPIRIGASLGGRLVAPATTTQVKLDRSVSLLSGVTYTFRVQLPDGALSDPLPITDALPITTDTLNLGGAGLPGANLPLSYAVWVITAGSPWTYRILDVSPGRDEVYTITATRHYGSKFAAVELGLALEDEPWTIFPTITGPVAPPTNIDVQEFLTGVGITSLVRVTVSWSPSGDRRTSGYQVQVLQGFTVIRDTVTDRVSVDFPDLTPGDYIFQVRTLGTDGQASGWLSSGTITVDGQPDPPGGPSGLAAQGGIKKIVVTWSNPAGRYLRSVEVWANTTSTFAGASKVGESPAGRFVHEPLAPTSVRWYWIRSIDVFGQVSGFVGPVSGTASYLLTDDFEDALLTTAKFAQSIRPVNFGTSLPAVGLYAEDDYFYVISAAPGSPGSGTLYKKLSGAWSATEGGGPVAFPQVVAGQVAAAAINTRELAVGAVRATNIAVEEVIANTIQVKDLILGTRKLSASSITEVASTDRYDWVSCAEAAWTTLAELWFYVDDSLALPAWVKVGPNSWGVTIVVPPPGGEEGGSDTIYSYPTRLLLDGTSEIGDQRFYAVWMGWHSVHLQVYNPYTGVGPFTYTGYRYLQSLLVKR